MKTTEKTAARAKAIAERSLCLFAVGDLRYSDPCVIREQLPPAFVFRCDRCGGWDTDADRDAIVTDRRDGHTKGRCGGCVREIRRVNHSKSVVRFCRPRRQVQETLFPETL